jgi:hypothetical protein
MRQASTPERTEEIQGKLRSSNCKAHVILEFERNGLWEHLEDFDGEKGSVWFKSTKNYKYANFALTPVSSTIEFSIININGKYSEGSGTPYSGSIDIDTKIKARGGYLLSSPGAEESEIVVLNSENAFFYYTQYNVGGYIEQSFIRYGVDISFQDFFPLYDAHLYDSVNYAKSGYYMFTYDNIKVGFYDVTKFDITCNNTNGVIYYRQFDNLTQVEAFDKDSDTWTDAGATVNGVKTISVISSTNKYIQIAVVYDSYDAGNEISELKVYRKPYIEWISYDVFYLDSPGSTDPQEPGIPEIVCKGRDAWKKAQEIDINLADLSGGVSMSDLIKTICDIIGVKYSLTSIADLSAIPNRVLASGLGTTKKAADVFVLIMQIIIGYGTPYQMYMEYDATEDDNILFVQKKPDTYEASFVFNYRDYESLGNKRKNYDKLMKQLTVTNESQSIEALVVLDTSNFTTTGDKVMTWIGNATAKDFTIVINSGDAVITLLDVEPTSMTFRIEGLSIDVDISITGSKWSSNPTYEGEFIDYNNEVGKKGISAKIINPLVISSNECKDISKEHINEFGVPVQEANSLKYPYMNLLIEQNDMSLLWARNVFLDDLFYVTGMTHNWNVNVDSSLFNLADSGLNFGDVSDFIYDDIMKYGAGYLYDMGISTPQSTDAEIDAASIVFHNVDF